MTNELKTEIATRADQYITDKKLSQDKFALLAKVNESYLSNILNGVFTYNASGGAVVEIADKYFIQIADVINYSIKKTYWPHVHTREFKTLVTKMKDAKDHQLMKMLIVETGAGKTYSVEQFKKNFPLHTYVIKLHSLMKISDLFDELINQLGIPQRGSKAYKRAQIIITLRKIKNNGGTPVVLLDESENINMDMMKMLKGFYDGILGYASIVLIGTEQLWELMQQAKIKDKQSGPQFYRRFKIGLCQVKLEPKLEERFKPFFESLNIEKPLRSLLCEICDNYGELHDYLEPALRDADRRGVELTEAEFRIIYDMPKLQKAA